MAMAQAPSVDSPIDNTKTDSSVETTEKSKKPHAPLSATLPGKLLAVCICVLPFITHYFTLTLSDEVKNAYYLSSNTASDFEQLCREIFLIAVAVLTILWMGGEKLILHQKRRMNITRPTIVILICLALYLILGLISTLASDYPSIAWLGNYQLYEGYLVLISYVIIFLAAWIWVDSREVLSFVIDVITLLGFVIGFLTILEKIGYVYYNDAIVQFLGAMQGTVSYSGGATVTFGNPDYFAMYLTMLLPILTSATINTQINDTSVIKFMLRIAAIILIAIALLYTGVTTGIVIGFGVTIVYLLAHLWQWGKSKGLKIGLTLVVIVAIIAALTGYIATRNGDTFSQKLNTAIVGSEDTESDNFGLLSMNIDGYTMTHKNKKGTFSINTTGSGYRADSLSFTWNDENVTPIIGDNAITFDIPELKKCAILLSDEFISIDLGYTTTIDAVHYNESWCVYGIGGGLTDSVPQVSTNEWLQERYTYLNGRVYVWTNAISELGDNILIGNGPATALFYLKQGDIPALLNIFGKYVLYNKPHNWYLQMANDTGVVSAICIIVMLIIFFVISCRSIHRRRDRAKSLQTALWLSLLGYCLTAFMGDSLIYHAPMFWFLLGVAMAMMRPSTVKLAPIPNIEEELKTTEAVETPAPSNAG